MTLPSPSAEAQLCAQRHISLEMVPRHERLDAWQSLLGGAHEIAAEPTHAFEAKVASVAVDAMLVHRMSSSAQSARRTAAMIQRDGMDHFALHMCASPINVRTTRGDTVIPAGAISINDLSQSYSRDAVEERDSVVLVLARDLVAESVGDLNDLHGVVLQDGAGALIKAHMQALAHGARLLKQDAAPAAARATAELLAACLTSTADTIDRARAPLEAAALIRARRFIDKNLADQRLSPERVRQAVNISRATLYRLFTPLGGVAGYIQERRLRLVHRRLQGRRASETIALIGYECGFGDGAHLSRAFKQRFGRSPKDVAVTRGAVRPLDEMSMVEEWLAQFG